MGGLSKKKEVPLRAPNSFDDCRTDKEGKEGGADGAAAENNFLPIPLPPLLPLSGFDVIFFEAIFFCGRSDLTRCTSCTTMRSLRCMHNCTCQRRRSCPPPSFVRPSPLCALLRSIIYRRRRCTERRCTFPATNPSAEEMTKKISKPEKIGSWRNSKMSKVE